MARTEPPDQPARNRIERELGTNLFVEAGAGDEHHPAGVAIVAQGEVAVVVRGPHQQVLAAVAIDKMQSSSD